MLLIRLQQPRGQMASQGMASSRVSKRSGRVARRCRAATLCQIGCKAAIICPTTASSHIWCTPRRCCHISRCDWDPGKRMRERFSKASHFAVLFCVSFGNSIITRPVISVSISPFSIVSKSQGFDFGFLQCRAGGRHSGRIEENNS